MTRPEGASGGVSDRPAASPWYDDALYRELCPSRPTPPPAGCNLRGPTAELMRLEAERELWALAAEAEAGAA